MSTLPMCSRCGKSCARPEAKFCSRKCVNDKTIAERFWPKVDKDGPTMAHMNTPCWVWTGTRSVHGYGHLSNRIPIGQDVLHRCDNPVCVNPDHLFTGTARENALDMYQKGRHAAPTWFAKTASKPGEANGRSRLTQADVLRMRERRAAGETIAKIARDYDVHFATARMAILGINWRHVA